MTTPKVYRWSIKTNNVYSFCGFEFAGTIASYKNEVSGFVRKDRVRSLLTALVGYGIEKVNLITSDRYWKDYDKYQ